MNVPSTIFLMQNFIMNQMMHCFVLVFIHIKLNIKTNVSLANFMKVCEVNDDIKNGIIKRPTHI